MSANCAGCRSLIKQNQNEHNSIKEAPERGNKPCNSDLKISMKFLFHFPPFLLYKTFPTKIKPTKCPATMVCTGLEKFLKKRHVLEKSLNVPRKSLNIFENSLNKNKLR